MDTMWRQVWNKRKGDGAALRNMDFRSMILQLKDLNGFDSVKGKAGLSYEAILKQYEITRAELAFSEDKGGSIDIKSVYEVGCGCGANLLLFERDGIQTGGVDYSSALIDVAEEILDTEDLLCDEALHISTEPVYDCILSNSVFSYFPDHTYAEAVLQKMVAKCRYSIGILDLHYEKKKEAFLAYRRSITENYDEKYAGLDKLFYTKTFFLDFAEKHKLDVKFTMADLDGYWNNEFVFNCFLYKRGGDR